MSKFVSIKIADKDCKGIYLFCDTDKKVITKDYDAKKLVGDVFKLQIRTKINNISGKKVYTFRKDKKHSLTHSNMLQVKEYQLERNY